MQKLVIQPNASLHFKFGTIALGIGTLLVISLLSISVLLKMLLAIVSISYLYFQYQKQKQYSGLLFFNDQWQICYKNTWFPINIVSDSTLTSRVAFIRFTLPSAKKSHTFLLFRDAIDSDSYRQFLVIARTNQ